MVVSEQRLIKQAGFTVFQRGAMTVLNLTGADGCDRGTYV